VDRTVVEGSDAVEHGFFDADATIDDAAPPPHEKRGNVASGFTCPNCHGSVWELDDGGLPRIECRVGHAFSVDAFLGEQAVALEDAIWSAINALEERATTLRRFASRFQRAPRSRIRYLEQAELVQQQAGLLREGLARVIQAEEHGLGIALGAGSEYPETREGGVS
jgi:two-component system chemotaxis response regulator CheB